jgi:hypothetical protein
MLVKRMQALHVEEEGANGRGCRRVSKRVEDGGRKEGVKTGMAKEE